MQIAIHNLNMTYPTGKQALTDVSMELPDSEMIGLLGPNGAGKSTLMKLLVMGLLPTSGEMKLDGQPFAAKESKLKASLGYLPQTFGLYDELTVWQFLDYMACLKHIPNRKQAIEQAIQDTNLEEKKRARIRTLSGGQRQRVGIAQALIGDPKLLILDEPTVGLDPEERIHFRNLFSQFSHNRIVLLSTHIIEDIQAICRRLIVIDHGQILYDGSPEGLIRLAEGHVGLLTEQPGSSTDVILDNCHVTARINTSNGIVSRIVGSQLPACAIMAEPTLEDAYLYRITNSSHSYSASGNNGGIASMKLASMTDWRL